MPVVEQLRALEEIIYAELHRSIRFEKRTAEREVIVARGRYKFKSHPSGDSPNHIHLTWDGSLGRPERTVDSPAKLFSVLERNIKMKIVDETKPIENATIRYKQSRKLAWIGDFEDVKKESLGTLLDNLAKTTSLQFKVERQSAEIWFVTESKEN